MKLLRRPRIILSAVFVLLLLLISQPAHARAVEDLHIKTLPDGYEITIKFLLQLQYQNFSPEHAGKEFYVQLKTVNFQNLTDLEIDSLRERVSLGWDPAIGIPLQEITFEGSDPERPQVTFLFSRDAEFAVRSSADLRSLIVTVKTQAPTSAVQEEVKAPLKEEAPEEKPFVQTPEVSLPELVVSEDKSEAALMEEARDELVKGEYERAVQFYTKILLTAKGSVKQQAQEMLGVARERNGQLAHAKAEYQKYLQDYPEGPDADRVRQRLAGLVTATKAPQAPLKEAKRAGILKKPKWVNQFYGNFSQFFFRDQTIPVGGTTQINRYDLSTDLDLNSKWKNESFDIGTRFTGGHQENFIKGEDSDDSISALSFDMKSKKTNWYGRFGRQSLTTGGVLGRFDGTHLSTKLTPQIKMNGVFGFPVESVHQINVEDEKKFFGVNFDLGTYAGKWDFNTFIINQLNGSFTDRRAMGGEVRYFDPRKSFFTLLDYDVFYNALNIFLFNGHYTFPTKTTLNLVLDYRKSPLLMTNNAIQGQGVNKLDELTDRFTDDEIKQLAEDRTAKSKSLTVGVSQDLKEDLQLTSEVTLSELSGTISSGSVEGSESTGFDYFFSNQLIATNVVMADDVVITGVNYSDTDRHKTYTLDLSGRFPLTRKLRLIPKFRTNYRDTKENNDNRITLRPTLRVDYNLTKATRVELEGGFEFLNETTSGIKQKSTETFVSVGYRFNF